MSELGLLFLVARCSHPVALARRARDSSVFPAYAVLKAEAFFGNSRASTV
jgi:hypothetical protein